MEAPLYKTGTVPDHIKNDKDVGKFSSLSLGCCTSEL